MAQRAAPPHSELDVRLFGHAGVSVAGAPVKFAKRSITMAMLAYLILKRGQPVARETLAYLLFPEDEESAALAELRRYLYLANKALPAPSGEPWLVIDAESVAWNARAGAFVDVVEFERRSDDPLDHERAVELYTGDLLEDVYEDWVVAERDRLRSKYLALLKDVLDRRRAARSYEAAIGYAKRILAVDPWREDTLRDLMAIRYESGDTAGALAEYEAFAKRLRDDLAIAPMPETAALRQSILRNEAIPGSVAPSQREDEAAPRAAVVLPFVGRERELAKLRATWTRAARGAGTFALLGGEAGAGKTRLVAELCRLVQGEGGRVFVGTTSAPESMPYQAIVEALRSALPLLQARPNAPWRATLARLLPDLRDADGTALAVPESAERETARVHDALVYALRSLASPRPLVIVLEDLHWAGAATAEALGAIVRDIGRSPILIFGTCRDEETPPDHPVRALQRSLAVFANVEDVQVDRLSERDVADLVERMDGLRAGGAGLARRLYAQSEGNALFLNEAISAALERAAPDSAVPTSVAGLIAGRVAALGDEARGVAEVAAVAGIGFTVSLVREVSNAPAAAVARGIDELLDRRILREAGARTTHDYVFGHHLILEAIYDGIAPDFRAQRHSRIARYLESVAGESDLALPREIASHYERAGDPERSAAWYVTAARAAAGVYAYGDAIELATRALALTSSLQLGAAALDVRERALARRGDRDGQRLDIEALDRLSAGDARAQFGVLTRRVLLARSLGNSDEEAAHIETLRRTAETLDSDDARAQALVHAATHAQICGRAPEALELAREALAIYEKVGDLRGQFDSLFLLVDVTSNVGEMEASRAYLDAMHQRSASLADRSIEARALSSAATAELLRQKYRECFDLSERGLAAYLAINDREGEAFSRGRIAASAACLGDYTTAMREFDLAAQAYESIGNKRGLALAHTNRTVALMRLGQLTEALRSIERSNAMSDVVHEKRTLVANQVNESFINVQLGNAQAAKSLAKAALKNARELGYPVFEAAALSNLGNAERVLGEVAAGIEHMEAGLALRRPIQESRDYVDDLADLTLAYVAAGRTGDALATARELQGLGGDGFSGGTWPHYVWWAAAAGFEAAGKSAEAGGAAERARNELARFAASIEDAAARASMLALPINRRIAEGR